MKSELLSKKEDIIAWLNDYEVKDYDLVESLEYAYVVNTSGNVELSDTDLKFIAVRFNIVVI